MDRVPTLIKESTNVVRAKADRPKGAGFAKLLFGALIGMSHGMVRTKHEGNTHRYSPGWNSPPKAARR